MTRTTSTKAKETSNTVEIKRCGDHGLRLPSKNTKESAGYDLRSTIDFRLEVGQRIMIKTGFAWGIPLNYCGIIKSRSGLSVKNGIDVLAGVIDSDFRGEVRAVLINHGQEEMNFKTGDRIAQMIILPVPELGFIEVDELDKTDRGAKGFGSSGLK